MKNMKNILTVVRSMKTLYEECHGAYSYRRKNDYMDSYDTLFHWYKVDDRSFMHSMVEIASYIVAYPYAGLVKDIKDAIEDRSTGYGECCFSIDGDELPKTFIKDAEKKGVHVIYNNQTIVRGSNPPYNSTLRLQLLLQVEKQLDLIQRERLVLGRDLVRELMKQDLKEKGGEL